MIEIYYAIWEMFKEKQSFKNTHHDLQIHICAVGVPQSSILGSDLFHLKYFLSLMIKHSL